MENKITISELSAMLALATGTTGVLCERFIRELFLLIGDTLEKGEAIRIKNLGTFKLTDVEARKSVDVNTGEHNEIPQHKKIVFVAAKELAAMVNSSFEMFEAVELADDADPIVEVCEDASFIAAPTSLTPEPIPLTESEAKEVSKDGPDTAVKEQPDETITRQPIIKEKDSANKEEEYRTEKEEKDSTNIEEEGAGDNEEEPWSEAREISELPMPVSHRGLKRGRFGWGFLTGFLSAVALLALVAIIWFVVDLNRNDRGVHIITSADGPTAIFVTKASDKAAVKGASDSVNPEDNTNVIANSAPGEPADTYSDVGEVSKEQDNSTNAGYKSSDPVPTQPSDLPTDKQIYDVVSTTRYLTTMAKEYYGNFNLWPVIYEENKAILGHPDRIKPGTRVVVPPLSKYGIDPNSQDDIQKMKEKGKQIYARYK